MNGLVLVLGGVLVLTQVLGGNALERLGITGQEGLLGGAGSSGGLSVEGDRRRLREPSTAQGRDPYRTGRLTEPSQLIGQDPYRRAS